MWEKNASLHNYRILLRTRRIIQCTSTHGRGFLSDCHTLEYGSSLREKSKNQTLYFDKTAYFIL